MENRISAAITRPAVAAFAKGQVWKVGDVNLAVTLVGKTLVHYKQYRTRSTGIPATLVSKPELLQYLLRTKAVLVSG
jgi:hypothetical protein